jgi:hypothetical protein
VEGWRRARAVELGAKPGLGAAVLGREGGLGPLRPVRTRQAEPCKSRRTTRQGAHLIHVFAHGVKLARGPQLGVHLLVNLHGACRGHNVTTSM